MSYIPDARSKFKEQFYKGTEGASKEPERNPYWQGYLKKEDADLIRGYDWATDIAVNSFFDNIDNFSDELEDLNFDEDKVDINVLHSHKDYDAISYEEEQGLSKETRLLIIIRHELAQWMEANRDEFIVSRIDGYDLDEHEKHMDAVDSGKEEPQRFVELPDEEE